MSTLHKEDRIEMYDYPPHDEQILPIEAQMLNVNLIRLAQYLKLDIGFVDRTQSLQGNDPGNTDMVALGVAAASADVLAVDTVMAKALGFEPVELGLLHYADALGTGVGDLEYSGVMETQIADVAQSFEPHEDTEKQLLWREYSMEQFLP